MSLKNNQKTTQETTQTTNIRNPPPCKKFKKANSKAITLQTRQSTENIETRESTANIEFDGSKRKFCHFKCTFFLTYLQ